MKSKSKKKSAISLIVLVVTILILGILAAVVVISLSSGGIIGQAQNAVDKNNEAVNKEKSLFEKIEDLLNGNTGEGSEIAALIGTVVTENTEVTDEYGNKIVVPEGFKIVAHDNDTVKYTYSDSGNNIPTVQDGIVIEDATGGANNGTRFVWVPVGEIKNKDNTTTTISLGDTTNAKNVVEEFSQELIGLQDSVLVQKTVLESSSVKFKKVASLTEELQEQVANLTTAQTNCRTICDNNKSRLETLMTIESGRDIDTFVSTTNKNGGYYISQNQIGQESTTNYQPDSVSLAQEMYGEVKDSNGNLIYASDLINEYALNAANMFHDAYSNSSNISDIKGFTTQGYISAEGEGVSANFNQVSNQNILGTEQSSIVFKKVSLIQVLQQQVDVLTTAQQQCKTQCEQNSVLLSDYESYLNSVISSFGLSVNIEEIFKFNIEDDGIKFERITLINDLQQDVAELEEAQTQCKTMCDQTEEEISELESTTKAINGIGFHSIIYVQ